MKWGQVFGEAFMREAEGLQPFDQKLVDRARDWHTCAVGENAPKVSKSWGRYDNFDHDRVSPELSKIRSLGNQFPVSLKDANYRNISVGDVFKLYRDIQSAIQVYAKKYKKAVR